MSIIRNYISNKNKILTCEIDIIFIVSFSPLKYPIICVIFPKTPKLSIYLHREFGRKKNKSEEVIIGCLYSHGYSHGWTVFTPANGTLRSLACRVLVNFIDPSGLDKPARSKDSAFRNWTPSPRPRWKLARSKPSRTANVSSLWAYSLMWIIQYCDRAADIRSIEGLVRASDSIARIKTLNRLSHKSASALHRNRIRASSAFASLKVL